MSSTPNATTTARETAKNTPLKNAQTLRGIYNSGYEFQEWVLDQDRWDESSVEKSHKFDETIVVYDNDDLLTQVKELVEEREPVNIGMNLEKERYKKDVLETNFGWKTGAYGKSTSSELYPNIGIYCRARVTNGVNSPEEKDVHVMNLIGYGFDSKEQPDYQYFLHKYKMDMDKTTHVMFRTDETMKNQFKEDLIQRYRKIWLKACYICKFKKLKNLWYYGVGNNNFSGLLPLDWALSINFYNQIFAEAFGIDPTNSNNLHSTNTDKNDLTIPINFCNEYKINVLNLGTTSDKYIPDVLFTTYTTPEDTLYINAWDPWSIIGNGNAGDDSLDGYWGRNSNMSVLGWSMTNSKLLPDIVGGGDSGRKSKILSMKEILAEIEAEGGSKGAGKAPMSGDPTPPPSTPSCEIDPATQAIKNITTECQDAIFNMVAKPVISSPSSDEPKDMSNLVSAIGTDYSSSYATEKIMPPGSATLLYIGDTDLFNVSLPSTTTKTSIKIKYMIQASPANYGSTAEYITKDTLSNSVVNSLILAAKNGVETIFFPFIGGEIFYGALKIKVDAASKGVAGYIPYDTDQHAVVLVKGVTDFYSNFLSYGITSNPIKEIFFVTYNTPEKEIETTDKVTQQKIKVKIPEVKEHEAIQQAYNKAKLKYPHLTDVLKPSIHGNVISNAIYYSNPPHNKPNIAIVNAANTQLAFGAGVSNMCYAGLTGNLSATDKSTSKYQIKLNNIKTKFIEAFKAYIANPSAAPSSPPSSPPSSETAHEPAPETPKKPFADVLTTLQDQLTQESENDAEIQKLGITLPTDFLYPTDGDASVVKKNLNSAAPTIDVMITSFENATTDDATTKTTRDFYLGACRSIEAAYELVSKNKSVTAGTPEMMRANLLLNLRKNSLLLKVPARWNYATMAMGVEPGPPTDEKELMNYSLQDTIEYYSQEGGATEDEQKRFAELSIAEKPTEAVVNDAKIPSVDGRFTKGIDADMKDACFFVSALQLLFCDKDFLQLIIFLSCQADDYISNIQGISGNECGNKSISNLETITGVTYDLSQPSSTEASNVERGIKFLNDLVKLFKAYTKEEKVTNEIMKSLYDTLALRYGKQQDSSEVITRTIAYLECLDNPYVKKFLSNCFLKITKTITTTAHVDFDTQDEPEKQLHDKLIVIKPPLSNNGDSSSVQDLFNSYLGEEPEDFEFSKDKIKTASTRKKLFDILSQTSKKKCVICNEFLTFSENASNNGKVNSFFQGYSEKEKEYTTSLPREQSSLKITLDAIKNAIQANTSNDETCRIIVEDIKYVILNPMVKESGPSTYTNLKKRSKKNVDKYSEYIFININRTLESGAKNLIQIDISKTLDISNSKYTLVGYVFHSGSSSSGGHFVCVKCDSDGEPKVEISDTSVKKWTDKYASTTEWGTGVFLLIYKQKEGSQAGGGFKPRHNATATHTTSTSKSGHNSSFKVSSSKTKGKAKSRSHTQRVK